jgi:hypothetical protein
MRQLPRHGPQEERHGNLYREAEGANRESKRLGFTWAEGTAESHGLSGGRLGRCNNHITKTPELRFHALLGNGGRELHLEWGTDKYLVEGVLSRVQ